MSVRSRPLLPVHRPSHPSHPLQLLGRHGAAAERFQRFVHVLRACGASETDVHIRLGQDEAVAVAAGWRPLSLGDVPGEPAPRVQHTLPARRQLAPTRRRKRD